MSSSVDEREESIYETRMDGATSGIPVDELKEAGNQHGCKRTWMNGGWSGSLTLEVFGGTQKLEVEGSRQPGEDAAVLSDPCQRSAICNPMCGLYGALFLLVQSYKMDVV